VNLAPMAARLGSNHDATNTELAAAVHHKVAPCTIKNIHARRQPPFSRKRYIDREPTEAIEPWADQMMAFRDTLRQLPLRRVSADESAIFQRGVQLQPGPEGHAQKLTLHVYVKEHEVVHW